ncbi:MAG: hypothetical protein GVY09_04485 [Gammaproteobacteria bacterium]|jgi:hypothetical protein|nr:hypothetical protein [Gammaproteobacteria bacterium]
MIALLRWFGPAPFQHFADLPEDGAEWALFRCHADADRLALAKSARGAVHR